MQKQIVHAKIIIMFLLETLVRLWRRNTKTDDMSRSTAEMCSPQCCKMQQQQTTLLLLVTHVRGHLQAKGGPSSSWKRADPGVGIAESKK